MNNTTKVGVAVAAGYLLGRRRKAKLALTVASMLTGKRLTIDVRQLAREAVGQITSSPEMRKLTDEIKGELLQAGRGAVTATVTNQLDRVAESLHDRTEALRGAVEQALPQPAREQGKPGPEQGGEPGPEQGGEPGPEQGGEPGPEQGGEERGEAAQRGGEAPQRPRRRAAAPESGTQRARKPAAGRPAPPRRRAAAPGEAAERPRRTPARPGQARRRAEG